MQGKQQDHVKYVSKIKWTSGLSSVFLREAVECMAVVDKNSRIEENNVEILAYAIFSAACLGTSYLIYLIPVFVYLEWNRLHLRQRGTGNINWNTVVYAVSLDMVTALWCCRWWRWWWWRLFLRYMRSTYWVLSFYVTFITTIDTTLFWPQAYSWTMYGSITYVEWKLQLCNIS